MYDSMTLHIIATRVPPNHNRFTCPESRIQYLINRLPSDRLLAAPILRLPSFIPAAYPY